MRDEDVCSADWREGREETVSFCANLEQHYVMSNKGSSKEQAGSPAVLHRLLQVPSCPSCKSPGGPELLCWALTSSIPLCPALSPPFYPAVLFLP